MTKQKRTKRGERNTKDLSFSPTKSDEDIYVALADHRLLRTSQIASLTNRSKKAINGRMLKLFNAGYVDWVDPKKEEHIVGNVENLYALAPLGAKIAANKTGLNIRDVRYRQLNKSLKKRSVTHLLMINDFLVRVQSACEQSNGEVRYIAQREILTGNEERWNTIDPLKIAVRSRGDDLVTVPDILFGLEFTNLPVGRNRAFFFGEADSGSMQQRAGKSEDKSYNVKKYRTYYHYWKNGLHEKEFGFKNFRVLFFTARTELRARNLIDFVEPISPGGRNQWLFTTLAELQEPENILDAKWLTGKAEYTTLRP